jgi:hypothetical protein
VFDHNGKDATVTEHGAEAVLQGGGCIDEQNGPIPLYAGQRVLLLGDASIFHGGGNNDRNFLRISVWGDKRGPTVRGNGS